MLETGTRSAWIKRILGEHGARVIVADARKLRAISTSPYKTDRNDARILARLGLSDALLPRAHDGTPPLLCDTYVRPEEHQRIYDQLKLRDQVVRRRGDLIRSVRSVVKGTGATLTKCDAEQFPKRIDELDPDLAELVRPAMDAVEALTAVVSRLDAKLESIAERIPEVAYLAQVKGVGLVTALAFYTVIGTPDRFPSSRSVGPYLGMTSRRDQSGNSDPGLRITKTGNGFLRRLLVQCAQWILGPHGKDCVLRRWGFAYVAKNGLKSKRRARIAVARRLAVILLTLWRKKSKWEPLYGLPEEAKPPLNTVGHDDCAATPETAGSHLTKLADTEIAASPTDRTQPCSRPPGARPNESGVRRGMAGTRASTAATTQRAGPPATPPEEEPALGPGPRSQPRDDGRRRAGRGAPPGGPSALAAGDRSTAQEAGLEPRYRRSGSKRERHLDNEAAS